MKFQQLSHRADSKSFSGLIVPSEVISVGYYLEYRCSVSALCDRWLHYFPSLISPGVSMAVDQLPMLQFFLRNFFTHNLIH